jgi:hypothetical protein
MQKTAKAVAKHSAQLATGSTFAKKKRTEHPEPRVYLIATRLTYPLRPSYLAFALGFIFP